MAEKRGLTDLDTLNTLSAADFVAALDGVFEHAPWVAARVAGDRPFPTVTAVHDALVQAVEMAPVEEIVLFLGAHPELSARALPPDLTAESTAEQAGLSMAGATGAADLPALNHAYRDRFGIPFIVCVARHTPENILRVLTTRLDGNPAQERAAALAEVRHITRLRLVARLSGPAMPATIGHLSTHVLDTSIGRPAAGLVVTLQQEGRVLSTVTTDADGRTSPLLPPGPLRQGHHTLNFATGAYFAGLANKTLYATIPIPFLITEPEGRYHIPLLVAPFGYSTYRGS